jgi:hypothetical protein
MSNIKKLAPKERPVLRQGITSDWNIFLQDELNASGYGLLALDGDFGSRTLAEVQRFQKDLGLVTNGEVDLNTWTALDNHKKSFGWQPEWPSSLILTGIAGVDTLEEVRSNIIPPAKTIIGAAPRFWGRYFQGNIKDGEYRRANENKPLRDAGLSVLPITRQTNVVNGTEQDGINFGTLHAKDIVNTFSEKYLESIGDSFYVFLDVEGVGGEPSLSKEFYKGWSQSVINASSKVRLLPSVYLNGSDKTTLRNLTLAMREGSECLGVWLARYNNTPQIKPWSKQGVELDPPIPCKVLILQYVGDVLKNGKIVNNGLYDFNQINPFLDNPEEILKRFILPPA